MHGCSNVLGHTSRTLLVPLPPPHTQYTVIDDDVIENTEYVIATFYGVGPLNTNITQPAIYTLIITDDDGKIYILCRNCLKYL